MEENVLFRGEICLKNVNSAIIDFKCVISGNKTN